MKTNKTLKLLIIGLISLTCFAFGKEVVIGKGPIPIILQPGHEVRIEFPETIINLNIEAEADNALKTLIKPDGTVLWKATRDFPLSRALATTAKGELIVLDIKTGKTNEQVIKLVRKQSSAMRPAGMTNTTPEKVPNQDPYVLMPDFLRQQYDTGGISVDADNMLIATEAKKSKPVSYTEMAAFAMQHYIGPKRLIAELPAQRIKNNLSTAKLNRLIRVWNQKLKLSPLNTWVLDEHYITAIKVKNISSSYYYFDPRAIRGRFQFVASLHDALAPYGSAENETIWVFITAAPLAKSMLSLR